MSAPSTTLPPPSPPPAVTTSGGMPAQQRQRPTGVTILAVLAIIGGVVALIGAMFMFAAGAFFGALGVSSDTGALGVLGALGAVAGVFLLLYAAFAFAVAWGLFKRMRWAWYATLVLGILQALGGLMSIFGADVFSALLNLAIGGVIIWYLLSPDVQSWFGVSHKAPWTYKGGRPT